MQGHRQVQGITGPQAESWIVQQLSGLAETVPVEGAQFQPALQQSIEMLTGGLAGLRAEAVVTLLDAEGAVGFGDQPVAADQGVPALLQPCQRPWAERFRGQQGDHDAGVKVDHGWGGLTSAPGPGTLRSPKG